MKARLAVFAILGLFFILTTVLHSQTDVDTQEIDSVREKPVLDSKDLQVIDEFLAEAVRQLVRTGDFTSIAKIRTVILSRQSTQAQYAQQFSESAYRHISSALQQAEQFPEDRKFKVVLNLLILMDGLKDPRLADLALGMLKHENKAIRYWAVRCVAKPEFANPSNLNGATGSRLIQQIVTQLKGLVDTSGPEIIALIAEFANKVKTLEGENLVFQIADARMKKYADWTVEYELLDAMVLKMLCERINPANPSNPKLASRFAQLYSYVIQRYVSGQDYLSEANKQYLTSVLVEIEDKCIGRLQGRPQTTIKRAIERGDNAVLLQEHDRLLGNQAQTGELALKLQFNYGSNEFGDERNYPLVLPPPPKPEVQTTE